jgi:hypothetical protein
VSTQTLHQSEVERTPLVAAKRNLLNVSVVLVASVEPSESVALVEPNESVASVSFLFRQNDRRQPAGLFGDEQSDSLVGVPQAALPVRQSVSGLAY